MNTYEYGTHMNMEPISLKNHATIEHELKQRLFGPIGKY